MVITSTATTIFLRSLRARLVERFRVLSCAVTHCVFLAACRQNCVRPNGSLLVITSTAATIFLRSLRARLVERFRVLSYAVTHRVLGAAACRQNCVRPNGSSLVITSTAATIFLRSLRARLAERFRVLGAAARRQGTPCEGSLRKTFHWNVFLPSCAL